MAVAMVTPAGKYHGHAADEAEARDVKLKKKMDETIRIVSDAEWERIAANPSQRAELCSTLGKEL